LDGTDKKEFLQTVNTLGSFASLEGFWRHFLHVHRPTHLRMGMNVAIFRHGLVPAWETFPNGGCWIIRVPRSTPFLNRMWEELVIAVLGERFLTPEIVGCVLSVRKEYTNITVWNRDNARAPGAHYRIGERLKTILNLADDSTVDYKAFRAALQDKSTHKNAQTFMFTSEPTDGYA
jgi:translation initiation factor 4E